MALQTDVRYFNGFLLDVYATIREFSIVMPYQNCLHVHRNKRLKCLQNKMVIK